MNKYNDYKDLLSKTYDEAVEFLLQKYGFSQDDYYIENSYHRFMNGEIKNIKKGKYSRTSEGLYCHHIDEVRELKISDQSFVKRNKIPFEYQKKDRLVYCDLIEHTILHVLITIETSYEFGFPGYDVYLKPIIEGWYIEEEIPSPKWMRNCYHKSFLKPEEAVNILQEMQKILGMSYFSTPYEYHNEKQKEIAIERKDEEEAKEREKQIIKEKIKEFYQTYPAFEKMNISFDISRQKVIAMLYDYKYSDMYKRKKELDLAMKPVIKEELLKELHLVICNEDEIK